MLINGGRPVYAEKTGLGFSRNSYGTTSSISNAMYNVVCSSKGETGRISVTGAISVSAEFFFLKIIILIDQIKFLVCLTANFVG